MIRRDSPTGRRFAVVVMGTSAGGAEALRQVLGGLASGFPLPVLVVQHLHPVQRVCLAELLGPHCRLPVKEAEEKEPAMAGVVYLAPPNYHLLIEKDLTLALNTDDKVHHSRPSIDVLFESAALALGPAVIGVVLTGASADGAAGLAAITRAAGVAMVQDPKTACHSLMPESALHEARVDFVLPLKDMAETLTNLAKKHRMDP